MSDSGDTVPHLEELIAARFGDDTAVVRVAAMAGDASSRRYLRIWLDGSAPETVVAMVMDDIEAAKLTDDGSKGPPIDQLPYVNVHHFLTDCGVSVPELYADAAGRGVLLLEDIGDVALWDAVETATAGEVRRYFGHAIEQLLRLQIDGTARGDVGCIGFHRSFDTKLYQWEFDHFLEWGFSGRLDGPLPAHELAVLQKHFGDIAGFLGEQPQVLNHRDFHAWNLFVQNGAIRVIDFQDLLLAAAPYDLATLLGDRVTPQAVTPDIERQLVDDYATAWAAHRNAPWQWGEGELWEVYCACALQKAFKVVGRFHFLDIEKGKPGYLKFLPPTLERIRGLLSQRPEWAPISEVLQTYFPELRP